MHSKLLPFYNNAANARLISIQNKKKKHQNDILSNANTKEQNILHSSKQPLIYDVLILMNNEKISLCQVTITQHQFAVE